MINFSGKVKVALRGSVRSLQERGTALNSKVSAVMAYDINVVGIGNQLYTLKDCILPATPN